MGYMSNQLAIELPKSILTAADLVGRAFRETRLNWRPLLHMFWAPCLVNNLSDEISFWIMYYWKEQQHIPILVALTVFGMGVSIWSRVIIALRTFALFLQVSNRYDPNEASLAAKRNLGIIVVAMLPTIFVDLLLCLMFFAAVAFFDFGTVGLNATLNDSFTESIYEEGQNFLSILLYAVLLLACLPYAALCIVNAFFAAIVAREKFSIARSIERFCFIVMRAPRYVFTFLVLATWSYLGLGLIYMMSVLVSPEEIFSGTTREIVRLSWDIIRASLFSPFSAWWFASLALGGMFLYDQLCFKLEAPDVSKMLDDLRAKNG
jgi:hypothetical protein